MSWLARGMWKRVRVEGGGDERTGALIYGIMGLLDPSVHAAAESGDGMEVLQVPIFGDLVILTEMVVLGYVCISMRLAI